MPGVVAIFTGKDTADAKVGGLICGWVVKDKHGEPHKAPPHPVMALDTVRYVGDTVAMVVANSPTRRATPPRRSRSTTR
jgi:carbon-monoxide dehydrogenase large subunit